jgi:hypothetical protein
MNKTNKNKAEIRYNQVITAVLLRNLKSMALKIKNTDIEIKSQTSCLIKKVLDSTKENIVIKPKALIGIIGKIKSQSKPKNRSFILEKTLLISLLI